MPRKHMTMLWTVNMTNTRHNKPQIKNYCRKDFK